MEKLELALKYEIKQWYADAYLALAKRAQPLSVEEGKRLGMEIAIKMAGIRERRIVRMVEKAGLSSNLPLVNDAGPTTGTRI